MAYRIYQHCAKSGKNCHPGCGKPQKWRVFNRLNLQTDVALNRYPHVTVLGAKSASGGTRIRAIFSFR